MKVLSVNLAQVRVLEIKGQAVETGIFKLPVPGPHQVGILGLQGDVRVEMRRQFGEENHAVHVYPFEHYAFWEQLLQRGPFGFGQFGENLSTVGLLETDVRLGDVYRFGSAVLQVAQPRIPCRKLNARMESPIARTFLETRRVGFYLRVLVPGVVACEDAITLLSRDEASPTLAEFVRISQFDYWDAQGLERLLLARDLAPSWTALLHEKLERARHADGWFGYRELRVVRTKDEGGGLVSYELRCAQGRPLPPFLGGQFLMVSPKGSSAQNVARCAWGLSGDPADPAQYRVTLRPSTEERLHPGDTVRAAAPRGTFSFAADCSGLLLLTCGTGLAPALSMLKQWATASAKPEVLLLHDDSAGLPLGLWSELLALATLPGQLQLRTGALPGLWAELAAVRERLGPRWETFVAGPSSFLDTARAFLGDQSLPPVRVHATSLF